MSGIDKTRPAFAGAKRSICIAIAALVALLALPAIASADTTTWVGNTSSDWNVDANWDNGQPLAADTAVITASGTFDPVVNTAGEVATTVNLTGDKALTITTGGSLDVSGTIDVDSGTQVAVNDGTLEFGTLNVDNSAGLSATGGRIAGTLTATGPATVTLTIAGSGYGTTASNGVTLGSNIAVSQTVDSSMSGTQFLDINTHTFTLAGSQLTTSAGTPTINVDGGVSPGTLRHTGTNQAVLGPQLDSDGLVEDASTGAGVLALINLHSGAAGNQLGGTVSAVGDGILVIGGDDTTVKSGGLTVNNTSSEFGGVQIFDSLAAGSPNFMLNGQTVRLNGDLLFAGFLGEIVSGTGTFDNVLNPLNGTGDLQIWSGNFAAAANITIPSDTTADVLIGNADWTNTFTFNVNGTLLLSGTSLTASNALATPKINIGSTGLLNHVGSGGLVEPLVDSTGTIQDNSNGSAPLNLERTATPGQVNEYSGTMRTLDSSGDAINLGTEKHLLQGALTMDTSSGTASTSDDGNITVTDTGSELLLNGQTLTLIGDSLNHNNGNISGTGTINGPGKLNIEGTGGDFAGGGAMNINAPVDQSGTTNVGGFGSSLNIGGFWETSADITDTGATDMPINVLSSGVLSHECCGAHSVANDLTISGEVVQDGDDDWSLNGSPNAVTSTGEVNVLTDAPLDLNNLSNLSGTTLTTGTYSADDGCIVLDGAVNTLNARVELNEDGALSTALACTPSALAGLSTIGSSGNLELTDHQEDVAAGLVNNGLLEGFDGTVVADLLNNGSLNPGDSPGTFNVIGDYTQSSSGQLNIEIEDNVEGDFDVLNVVGDVDLDGELALLPGSGYVNSAVPGDFSSFLRYTGTRANTFATTTVNPPLAGGKPLTAVYDDINQQVYALVGQGPAPPVVPPVVPPAVDNPPQTRITTTKIDDDNEKAKFRFKSSDAGSKFRCKLSGRGGFKPCNSPKIFRNLDPGNYTFKVKATDPAGQTDSSPAKRKFEI